MLFSRSGAQGVTSPGADRMPMSCRLPSDLITRLAAPQALSPVPGALRMSAGSHDMRGWTGSLGYTLHSLAMGHPDVLCEHSKAGADGRKISSCRDLPSSNWVGHLSGEVGSKSANHPFIADLATPKFCQFLSENGRLLSMVLDHAA